NPKWPHCYLRRLPRRPLRSVEGVLLAVAHDAEPAVNDPPVWVQTHPDCEVILPVVGVPVEPVAVIDVPVTGCRVRDGLRRLVDRVIVKLRKHGSPYRSPKVWQGRLRF